MRKGQRRLKGLIQQMRHRVMAGYALPEGYAAVLLRIIEKHASAESVLKPEHLVAVKNGDDEELAAALIGRLKSK